MRINKIIAAALAASVVMSQAFAASFGSIGVNMSPDNSSVTISGDISGSAESVVIKLLKPGKTDSTATASDILAVEEIWLDNGEKSFSTTIGLSSTLAEGKYSVYLSGEGITPLASPEELWYKAASSLRTELGAVTSAVNETAMQTALFGDNAGAPGNENADVMGLKTGFYVDSVESKAAVSRILFDEKAKITSIAALRENFKIASVMAAFETSNVAHLLNGDGVLADYIFPEGDTTMRALEDYFNSKVNVGKLGCLTQTARNNVINSLKGKRWVKPVSRTVTTLSPIEQFKTDLADQIVYEAIFNNQLEGHGHIPSVVDKFDNITGYDESNFLSWGSDGQLTEAYNIFTGGAKDTVELGAEFDEIEAPTEGDGGGNGGGNGGTASGPSKGDSGNASTSFGDISPNLSGELKEESERREEEASKGFKDLAGFEWAKEAVEYLSGKGIVSGVGDKKYAPGRNVTRAEFAKLLVNTLGYKTAGGSTEFTDVDANEWYAPYIAVLAEKNITTGTGDGRFNPNVEITRQEVCTLIYRALTIEAAPAENEAEAKDEAPVSDENKTTFLDDAEIDAYAKAAVKEMSGMGIIKGDTVGTFRPRDMANRAEAAVIFYRLLEVR